MDKAQLFQQLLQQSDPYRPFEGAVGAINYTPTKPGQEMTSIGVGLGKALLAGLLRGKSLNRDAEQTSLANQMLRDPNMAMPEGLDKVVGTGLQQQYIADQAERDAASASALKLEVLKQQLEEPDFRKSVLANLGLDMGTSATPTNTAATSTTEAEALPSIFTKKPDSATTQPTLSDLKAQGYTDKQAREILKQDREESRKSSDDELNLQSAFLKLPEVGDFNYKRQGAIAFMQALQDPSGTSDFELIRRGTQAIEPGLAVRRDDERSLEDSSSKFGRFKAAVYSALKGESKLDDATRKGIARMVKRSYESTLPDYNRQHELFSKKALKKGYNPDFVTVYKPGQAWEDLFGNVDININDKIEEPNNIKTKVQQFSSMNIPGDDMGALKSVTANPMLEQLKQSATMDEILAEAVRLAKERGFQ